MDNTERLELEVLRKLLEGDDPVLEVLRHQLSYVQSVNRSHTGVGAFTDFTLSPEAPRLLGNPTFTFGDVFADVEGVKNGASFVLFIENGMLSTLETFTFDETWPESVGRFQLRYIEWNSGQTTADVKTSRIGKDRNLEALRQTPGWPASTK